MTPTTDAVPGSSPSFVDGTPSSRSSNSARKRGRQRSASPTSHNYNLSPRPHKHEIRQSVVPPFVIRQYLALESGPPLKDGEVAPGALGESAEREAGYLVDDGSLLARDQVRLHQGGGSMQGVTSDEGEVEWRTVPFRQLTMEGEYLERDVRGRLGLWRGRSMDQRSVVDLSAPTAKDTV